jgi:hypothetical protein
MNRAKPEDVNMELVGFRITTILTDYAEKLPGQCSRISSSSIRECRDMTLAISTLRSIFPLHTKTQDYHLKYCPKCHSVDIFSLKEVTYVDEYDHIDN